jgi:hypothetical protein
MARSAPAQSSVRHPPMRTCPCVASYKRGSGSQRAFAAAVRDNPDGWPGLRQADILEHAFRIRRFVRKLT